MKRRTAELQKRFLELYVKTGNITVAAREAGIQRDVHYKRWMRNPEYAAKFGEASEVASDLLIEEARRRAQDGWDEPVIYQGELSYEKVWNPETRHFELTDRPLCVRKYDSTMLMFLIKARRPEYRDTWKGEIEHKGQVARPAPDFSILNDEEFEFLRRISARANGHATNGVPHMDGRGGDRGGGAEESEE